MSSVESAAVATNHNNSNITTTTTSSSFADIYQSDDNYLMGFLQNEIKSEMTDDDLNGQNVDPSLQYLNMDVTKSEAVTNDQEDVQYADESIAEMLARAEEVLRETQAQLDANREANDDHPVREQSIEIVEDNPDEPAPGVELNFETANSNRSVTPSPDRVRYYMAEADATLAFAANAVAEANASLAYGTNTVPEMNATLGEDDSIIEVTQLRQASPLEIVDDGSDDDVIFVGATSPGIVDLCGSPNPPPPPPDEIPDVQVVNFLLDHTQPPNHRFRRTAGTPRSVCPMVQLMAQQMEESVATSAALAAATRAVETAAAAAAASDASPTKRQRTDNQMKQISCAVCLEHPFENRPSATVCGHIFCEPCIQMAIKQCKKCPMCNRKLSLKSVHPIYV